MPIYEYACSKCRKTIEVIQRFSDPILRKHQGCGGTLTKLVSTSGFQFKGSGWYVTDYARKSEPKGSDSDKPPAPSKEAASKESPSGTGKTKEPKTSGSKKSGES